MRGPTHAMIGIAAASLIQGVSISAMANNPVNILPIAAGCLSSLFCDIDTVTSTISNMLSFGNYKSIRKTIAAIYLALMLAAIYKTHGTKYEFVVLAASILTAASFSGFSQAWYMKLRRAVLIIFSVFTIIAGMAYEKYSIALAGLYIALMIFSPHRGYSHSLLAAAAGFGIVKYICLSFGLPDVSVYFAVGMISHIIADLFTDKGVAVLFPYPIRITLPLTITTGSPVEVLITAAAVGILAIRVSGF